MSEYGDFSSRADAYEGVEHGVDTPRVWTPEHVQLRLKDAFDVVFRGGGRTGPAGTGSGWPAILREFHELIDEQSRLQMQQDFEDAQRRAHSRPTSLETSRSDAALAWCLTHLGASPLHADALQLFCLCQARNIEIAKVLRERKMAASKIAARMQEDENATRSIARQSAAKEATDWANRRLAHTNDPDRVARIKTNAALRFRRSCEGILPAVIRPSMAMPNKVIGRTLLDQKRKEGAAIIADALNQKGTPTW